MTNCQHCGAVAEQPGAFCEMCGKPLAPPRAAGMVQQTLGGMATIGGDLTLHRDAYPKAEVPALAPGDVFADRYTIESTIGAGGMGVVYRARDTIGNRAVALKLIRPDRLGGDRAVERLIAEGVTTQDISHTNIVKVYHVDQRGGQPFIAMEYVDGVSLREWHRRHVHARTAVPMVIAARIVAEMLDGLKAAHEAGVVHRDLKPENIMLTAEPEATAAPLKILDFGIARSGAATIDSGATSGLGTPRYMAPEQITNPDSAGPSADLYSLSTIFYELLVDVLPQGGWQAPSSGRSDVPRGIDALIQSGLQNRPASRPQSAQEYRQALVQAMGGARAVAAGDAAARLAALEPQAEKRNAFEKNPRLWLLIGGGVAAIALLSLFAGGAANRGTDQVQSVHAAAAPAGADYSALSGDWLDGAGDHATVTVSADGRFSGSGQTPQGQPLTISGALNGMAGEVSMTANGGVVNGAIQWDGGCHLNFQTASAAGDYRVDNQFHVNHAPGAPCPS